MSIYQKSTERMLGAFYSQDSISLAKALLGKWLVCKSAENVQYVRITETEAYLGSNDLASHARFGNTKRTKPLFKMGGTLYVYKIYGIHYMLNIVSSLEGDPQAVLIRKGQLLSECSKSKKMRLINVDGPGKLCKQLFINENYNNIDCVKSSCIYIIPHLSFIDNGINTPLSDIYVAKRIGIDYAKDWKNKLLRFYFYN